jgi:hypothetical protein
MDNNNIIPSNVKEYIHYKPEKYEFNDPKWSTIGLKIIEENNEKKYKLVFINQNHQKKINILMINENDKLDKDSIYIGILDYRNKNKIISKIVYYGNYIDIIEKNGNTIIKFKNNKLFSYKIGKLYKLTINVYKKYGIINTDWNDNNLIKKINDGNDFLFKKLDKIPNYLINNISEKINSMNNADKNNYINNYKTKISDNYTLLSNNSNKLNIIDINNINSGSKIIKIILKNNKNNIKNNKKLYFANIKYNFSDDEVFDKIIYLGNFVKKEGDFLFFENIIINPKSEKLKKFDLYYAIK